MVAAFGAGPGLATASVAAAGSAAGRASTLDIELNSRFMGLTNPAGQKKNRLLDLGANAFVVGVLALTPLLVEALREVPDKGPDKNPSILIIFLVFLNAIVALSLWASVSTLRGKTKPKEGGDSLTQHGLDLMNVLSKAVAGLFLISGFVKLQDPIGFGYKLDDYWDFFAKHASFFPAELMRNFSVPIAGFVSVFEVALGFALITGYKMRTTAWLLMLMLLFFTMLTGFAAFTGELQDCGCFGDALKLEPWQTFGKDILLLLPGTLILVHSRRIHPYYRSPLPGFATIGSFVAGAAISVYCFLHLELLDFRGAYKVGQDLCYNSVNYDEEGQVIAHDFSWPPETAPVFCDQDFCQGAWLMVVMYDMEDHPKADYDSAAALTTRLQAGLPWLRVVGMSNTGPSVREEMGLMFPQGFCWNDMDQKVLRTIIRSTPGYVLVQDGIVQKKWHHNDMPSVEELFGLARNTAPAPSPLPAPDSLAGDSAAIDTSR